MMGQRLRNSIKAPARVFLTAAVMFPVVVALNFPYNYHCPISALEIDALKNFYTWAYEKLVHAANAFARRKQHYGYVAASIELIDRWARMSRSSAAVPIETAKQVLE